MNNKKPPFLASGDQIALLSTARHIDASIALQFETTVKLHGFKPIVDEKIFARNHQMAGDSNQRSALFQKALDDPNIKAIWFARGGYGSIQLAEKIDWSTFQQNPKWLVGFSDITVWHTIVNQMGICTIHAPMPSTFKETNQEAIHQTFALLTGVPNSISFEQHPFNSLTETTKGVLWGGNLSIIASLIGSASLPAFENSILCIEDVGEYLYHIDRLMFQLRRSGILAKQKVLIVGGMSEMNDNSTPFGETAYQIVKRHCHELNLKVVFDAPIGHINNNFPFLLGEEIILQPMGNKITIQSN